MPSESIPSSEEVIKAPSTIKANSYFQELANKQNSGKNSEKDWQIAAAPWIDGVGSVFSGISQVIPQSNKQTENLATSQITESIVNTGMDMARQYGGFWGNLAATANDVVMSAQNAIPGLQTTGMTKTDAVMNKIPIFGAINALGGKTIDGIQNDKQTWSALGSSYNATQNEVGKLAGRGDKARLGLFSRGKANTIQAQTWETGRLQNTAGDIAQKSMADNQIMGNQASTASSAYALQQQGGIKQNMLTAAKQGTKIQKYLRITSKPSFKQGGILEESKAPFVFDFTVDDILEDPEETSTQPKDIQEYKEGGQMNVIPEGALHARRHGMENDEHITKKGIPVITEEGGEIVQQAEIEVNEIIFTKEVTDKLEELYKVFNDDDSSKKEKEDAALEAGKLLATEIMDNTDDRTGLIQSVE